MILTELASNFYIITSEGSLRSPSLPQANALGFKRKTNYRKYLWFLWCCSHSKVFEYSMFSYVT